MSTETYDRATTVVGRNRFLRLRSALVTRPE
jgi:hypothetical protein